MSTQPDWSKAPEGATHYRPSLREWYKQKHRAWLWKHGGWELIANDLGEFRWSTELVDVPRPIEWSGEGLPPVGTDCACGLLGRLDPAPINQWREGETIKCVAHVSPQGGAPLPLFWNARTCTASTLASHCYSPLRTPEQIAAEEALAEIEALYIEGGPAAVYDAGYRRQESA